MDGPALAFTKLDRDRSERFHTLRRELDASSLGLNMIALQAGQRGRIHKHEHHPLPG